MVHIWVIEPAAAADDAAWQGRRIFRVAVLAENPAFARLAADRWASDSEISGSMRPGFEDQNLYHVREAPAHLNPAAFVDGDVLVIGEPTDSVGPQNERPMSGSTKRDSPEGKTATSSSPNGDVANFPGDSQPDPRQ